jgi:hypothetical protein
VARDEFKYYAIKGIKGINQQERLADPELELADARNLWAPNGRLEKRPGYQGAGATNLISTSYIDPLTVYKEDPLGTFTQTEVLSSLPVGSRWYLSFNTAIADADYANGISLLVNNANTNNVVAYAEYWNGFMWAPIKFTEGSSVLPAVHLVNGLFYLAFPRDFAKLTIGAVNSYWIRFTLQNAGSTEFSSPVDLTAGFLTINQSLPSSASNTNRVYSVFVSAENNLKYIAANMHKTTKAVSWLNVPQLAGGTSVTEFYISTLTPYSSVDDEPPSIAVVPQFGEVYLAYEQATTVHKITVRASADVAAIATVETDPTLVGSNSDYDPAFIPQLGAWPEAKYIAFHRGEMWAANLKGGSAQIRWSAGSDAYRIWPQISTDVAIDVDQSAITGLFAFNQNMFVFKDRSIWQMIYTGLNDQKLNTYRAEKVVAGVGCVSNSSIQDVQGNLVFLGQDGIYQFDGVRATKISDRIQKTLDSVVSGRKRHAVSCHWREKSLYMLAVTTAGSATNNLVIVWDYKNDSWWIWDDIEAVSMFAIPDALSGEQIYFVDLGGRVFQLGIGHNDNGGTITAYGTSQRLANSLWTQHIRSIEPLSTNTSRSLTIEVASNDEPMLGLNDTSPTFTDPGEKEYLTAVYNADHYTVERDRRAHVGTFVDGEWFRVKFTHEERHAPFVLNELYIGTVPIGKRTGNG